MILKKTPLRYRENAKFRRLENGNGRKQYIIHNNILLYLYRYNVCYDFRSTSV